MLDNIYLLLILPPLIITLVNLNNNCNLNQFKFSKINKTSLSILIFL